MSKSFKAFIAESNAQSRALSTAKAMLGADEITTVEKVSDKSIERGKRIGHKFVDTPAGPWIVEIFQDDGSKIARITPPKGMDNKQIFVKPKNSVNEDIFDAGHVIYEARGNNMIGKVYDSSEFMWHKGSKSFSAEASAIGNGFTGQLWNDSADQGFGMRSAKTGKVVLFTLQKIQREDGHIQYWKFVAYNPTRDPKLDGLTVTIFNV